MRGPLIARVVLVRGPVLHRGHVLVRCVSSWHRHVPLATAMVRYHLTELAVARGQRCGAAGPFWSHGSRTQVGHEGEAGMRRRQSTGDERTKLVGVEGAAGGEGAGKALD